MAGTPALQYRTYLYDPEKPAPERPVQAFHTTKEGAEDWAASVMKVSSRNSQVWLFRMEEILEGHWKWPEKKDGEMAAKLGALQPPSNESSQDGPNK